MSNRTRSHELEVQLHESKEVGSTQLLVEYANLQVEDLKDQLVGCEAEHLKLIQGRASAYLDLIRTIEDEPHNITN